MAMNDKLPKATVLWLGVLSAVLAFLYLETSGPPHRGSNFFLSADSNAIGAEVFVDGKVVDTISSASGSELGSGAWWGHLTAGKHLIEVKKKGYAPFAKEIVMQGEQYLGVDLKPVKD